MATRKASDSNLTGKKYNDASAGASKIVDVPDAPATPTLTPGQTVSPVVNFTAANTGGISSTFTVAANPGNATWTGNTSPITATGLSAGTAYTFRVRGNNSTGSSPYSPASASVTVTSPQWGLLATYNTSTSYTVPSGVTKIGVVVISGGSSGGNGCCGNPGAPGGSSGSAVGFWDYPVNSGTNYNVTVGGVGGTSNFGGLAQATSGNATSNFNTNAVIANAAGGGNNGAPYYLGPGAAGGSSSPANITLNIPTNGPYNHPHGGGGGGGAFSGSGGPGGASYGGQGANGPGGSGSPGNGPGGGGGGASNSGSGGSGQPGRIYLYGFGNI